MSVPRKKLTVIDGGGTVPPGGDAGAPDWRQFLTRNREEVVQASPHNLMLILEHDPELSGLFWLDEFGNRIVLDRQPPWTGGTRDEFTEVDALELAAWIGHPSRYGAIIKTALVLESVEAIARRRRRHTVRDYLAGLKWDGTPRLQRMFVELFGAEDSPYNLGAAGCFLVSAVSRILWCDSRQPTKGSKVDFMLVLEGGQGAGKTTAVLELFGAEWYAEATESPAHKDFYQTLRGRWGVEIGEMDSFNKADVAKVKQAITTRFDVYRPSYGRTARSFRRECVFVGTVNKDDYLRDETGARRFLPLKVGRVDIERLVEQRDQLWAEAVKWFEDGFEYWKLPEGAEREQDDRFSEDVWTERVHRWITGRAGDSRYEHLGASERGKAGEPLEFSVADVLTYALHVEPGRQDRPMSTRVGSILTRLGCHKYKPTRLGRRVQIYYMPEPEAPAGG
ncbi:VapE family protein [Luteimonas sp. M1R5S18]|uniref:VapE family protein n=1 Tax=Luteimonas rhizosphaericola TaxID=3042024 RepID=A0ABT6JNS0_9GAMM|nr:VapE domain-containing protein [Luteimonas rhizosphaericola]MDH5832155.1 VapE family protein [Luteimonas rhizosphaericola]